MSPALRSLLFALPLIAPVAAHLCLWDPAMYGWNASDPNQQEPVYPLYNLTFDEWWFHGYVDIPPAENTFMNLPAGGVYHGEVACNKALTTYGDNPAQQTGIYACDGTGPQGGIGAMHTSDAWESPNPVDVKGCGLSIAYQSDVTLLKPSDFAVISTNWSCPWFKQVDFEIPADLPPCPEGGCHCQWGWIHADDAGSEQMYTIGYKCNVTGATGTQAIPQANTANKCDYPTDTSNCTVGAKQMHYWLQAEQNNNFQGYYDPPFYNGAYGFMNGAQTDLFAGSNGTNTTIATTATASSSSSSSSATGAPSGVFGSPIASSSSSSSSPSSTVSTIPTTSPGVQVNATAAVQLASNGTITTTNTTNITTTNINTNTTTTKTSCNRRKRAYDRLDDADHLKRHEERAARRRARRSGSGVRR